MFLLNCIQICRESNFIHSNGINIGILQAGSIPLKKIRAFENIKLHRISQSHFKSKFWIRKCTDLDTRTRNNLWKTIVKVTFLKRSCETMILCLMFRLINNDYDELKLHWENYIYISYHIEWDMIVVRVFFSILNQMEFYLIQKI